jgi:hypothetical protein
MKRTRMFCSALLAGIVTASLFAMPLQAAPQDASAALRAAIFAPAAVGTAVAGLPPGATPMISACAAGTPFCTCAVMQCSQRCGRLGGTVTNCSATQGTYTCTCGGIQ